MEEARWAARWVGTINRKGERTREREIEVEEQR